MIALTLVITVVLWGMVMRANAFERVALSAVVRGATGIWPIAYDETFPIGGLALAQQELTAITLGFMTLLWVSLRPQY